VAILWKFQSRKIFYPAGKREIQDQGNRSLLRVMEIASKLDSATLSGLLDRLAKAGFIERRANPNDRRAILV